MSHLKACPCKTCEKAKFDCAVNYARQKDLEWKMFIEFSILRLLSKKKAEEVREAMDRNS